MRLVKLCAAAVLVAGVSAAVAQPPGGGRGQGGRGMGPGQAGGLALVGSKTVQAALKLTDDQVTKLKAVADKQAEKRMSLMRDKADREEMMQKMTAMQEEAKKELAATLKEEQAKRLKEIEMQMAGARAFAMPDVQTALKLTDEQKDKLKDAADATQKEIRELQQEMFSGGRPDAAKMAEFQKKQAGMNKELMAKVDGMLTADQKAAWKTLTGEAVDVAKVQGEMQAAAMAGFRKKKDD